MPARTAEFTRLLHDTDTVTFDIQELTDSELPPKAAICSPFTPDQIKPALINNSLFSPLSAAQALSVRLNIPLALIDARLLLPANVIEFRTDLHVEVLNIGITAATHALKPATVHPIEFSAIEEAAVAALTVEFMPVRLFGMTYADKYWTEIPNPEKPATKRQPSRSQSFQAAEADEQIKKRRHSQKSKRVSLWDLIYVLLKPPLTLGEGEEVTLPHNLFPYQRTGVEFLINNESALLADDMGTGKTVMTLVALRILFQKGRANHALIVCPPSVVYEWRRHLEEWAPDLYAAFIRGSKQARSVAWASHAHVYITTYDTLRRDIEYDLLPLHKLDMFDVVVLDEAHHIKNSASGRARAVRKLRAKQRWALTGTPVQNRIEDLVSLFAFLRPGHLPTNQIYDVAELIKPFFLRRRKQDVMTEAELPPKLQQEYWLTLDKEQRALYDRVENQIKVEIASMGDQFSEVNFRSRIMALKQICNFMPDKGSSPKVEVLKEQIEQIIGSGRKVIVFSQYRKQGIEKLQFALQAYGTATIIGGQSETERTRQIERFKKSDNVHILLASVQAGGEGLNLVEASYVIHFDHWWNPAVMWQAEDRAHRRGQKEVVNVYSYWMQDTIDERIHTILKRKKMLFQHLVDDQSAHEDIERSLSQDDMLEMLGVKLTTVTKALPQTDWKDQSLPEIQQQFFDLTPLQFETLTQNLMKYLGYEHAQRVGSSGDGGIDVIAVRNTDKGVEKVAAQCKRYQGTVGPEVARGFAGALRDKNIKHGLLVTSSDFSDECRFFCEKHYIQTIAGLDLAKYVKQFGLKLK